MAIPVIDMENMKTKERKIIMSEIGKACEDYGFFQLLNHGIPHTLLDRVKHVSSDNFDLERQQEFIHSLPVRTLRKVLDEESQNSYGDPKKIDNVDWEDCFVIQYNNEQYEWPSEPIDFKETMEEFGKELIMLAETLLEILSENLGLDKDYFEDTLAGPDNKAFFGTKVSHYPPCPRPDLIQGLRAHTDAGGLILLFQDDMVGGLQVLNNGNWIDVKPTKNAIVVNVGDQLEAISNGKYKSAWHRVLSRENGNRMSVASFYNPSFNAVICPARQLTRKPNNQHRNGENSGLQIYPRYVFGDYMNVYEKQKYLPKEPRFEAMQALNSHHIVLSTK